MADRSDEEHADEPKKKGGSRLQKVQDAVVGVIVAALVIGFFAFLWSSTIQTSREIASIRNQLLETSREIARLRTDHEKRLNEAEANTNILRTCK